MSEAYMGKIMGLGHVGIYVRDLERMVSFYRDTLGLQVTKQNWRAGVVFLLGSRARDSRPRRFPNLHLVTYGGSGADHLEVRRVKMSAGWSLSRCHPAGHKTVRFRDPRARDPS